MHPTLASQKPRCAPGVGTEGGRGAPCSTTGSLPTGPLEGKPLPSAPLDTGSLPPWDCSQLPQGHLVVGHFSHSVASKALRPHGLQPARLFRAWDFPGKNTGVGCHSLLQGSSHPGIQPGSPALQADSSPLSQLGSPTSPGVQGKGHRKWPRSTVHPCGPSSPRPAPHTSPTWDHAVGRNRAHGDGGQHRLRIDRGPLRRRRVSKSPLSTRTAPSLGQGHLQASPQLLTAEGLGGRVARALRTSAT